jgi:O-antigen biosynthesis protein
MTNLFRDYELVQRSGLFDSAYYRHSNPELSHASIDPLTHYLETGGRLGRNPSKDFDAGYYLAQCQKSGELPDNPLVHYIREGLARGLKPSASANGRNGQASNDDWVGPHAVSANEFSAFAVAALRSGLVDDQLCREKLGVAKDHASAAVLYLRIPTACRPDLSHVFDRKFYLEKYPDVAAAQLDPFLHFFAQGCAEDRSPNALVDVQFIRSSDSSLLSVPCRVDELCDALRFDLVDPGPYFSTSYYQGIVAPAEREYGCLEHFLRAGCLRAIRPNALFDPIWYCRQLEGVLDIHSAIRHFVLSGDRDGRSPSLEFCSVKYLERYMDVTDAAVAPLAHYLGFGCKEGRSPVPAAVRRGSADASSIAEVLANPGFDDAAASYEEIRELIASARQRRKDRVTVRPPQIIEHADLTAASLASACRALSFKRARKPKLSILIPVYNEVRVTLECLASVAQQTSAPQFEVIIADDASDDADMQELAKIRNIVYLRQESNLGFLLNCNAAFAQARGEYVLLLNNDAQLADGALEALTAVLDREPDVAAVGPKILYPNGRLQEAGCAIDATGATTMTGLFQDPDLPQYGYARDVHYCSGAAILLRRAVLEGVLFDEEFAPAYCEDTDLCLRLLSKGHKVRYCPDAVAVHHLSVSTNKQSVTRRLQLVKKNQQKLLMKWQDVLQAINAVRVIAFYLPQFHPTPENDLNWGRGFTEWTNVAKARPRYSNHYQPHLPADLGFYDLRVKETVARQAELARRYGVDGFCVYYYNFGAQRALDQAFEAVVADRGVDFPYFVCWANENWTRRWDGGEKDIIFDQKYDEATLVSIVDDVVRYAHDPRYLRVGDKPMFAVYRPMLLPDPIAFARLCRQRFAEGGFAGCYLVFVESMETAIKAITPSELGFDACIEFPPQGNGVEATAPPAETAPQFAGTIYDYVATVEKCVTREGIGGKRHPAVFPGWDNTPRQPTRGNSFVRTTPEAFQAYCEEKLDEVHQMFVGEERLLFVNAWNEWAEGAHLEPDQHFGHRWLDAVRNARLNKILI